MKMIVSPTTISPKDFTSEQVDYRGMVEPGVLVMRGRREGFLFKGEEERDKSQA